MDKIINKNYEKNFDIVIIGHFSNDENFLFDKKRVAIGGGVYYSCFPPLRAGLKVAIITKLAKDDFSMLNDFKEESVTVFALPSTKTTRILNIYPTKNLDLRICKLLDRAEPFELHEIPDIQAEIIHISPLVRGEISLEVIKILRKKAKILSFDVQGLVRVAHLKEKELLYEDFPKKRDWFQYIDILKVDRTEAEILTGKKDLKSAAKTLVSYGPKEVIITYDKGVLVYTGRKFYKALFKPKKIKGRTGRGDTCIGAYLAKRLMSSPEESCRFAAEVTTIKLEKPGPFKDFIVK